MARYFSVLAAIFVVASGAPPSGPLVYPQQLRQAPANIEQLKDSLDYYAKDPELAGVYVPYRVERIRQLQQLQQQQQQQQQRPAHLETLEPDSEVELIPGAQQPQQPPQQTPVQPPLPGLVPGQRVFIVHMPVPGSVPGYIGGYRPLYIVAAAPQNNNGIIQGIPGAPGVPGYQNAILLQNGPGNPFDGLPNARENAVVANAPLPYRGNQEIYRSLVEPYYFQSQVPYIVDGPRGAVRLTQLVTIPARDAGIIPPAQNLQEQNAQQTAETNQAPTPKRVGAASSESKEAIKEEPRRNAKLSSSSSRRS